MNEKKKWYEKISLFQKLKNIKHIEIIIAVIFAIIILLVYLSSLGSTNTTSTNGGEQTQLEARLCGILEDLEGVGKVSVMINYLDKDESMAGVVVVASGADDVAVRLQILRAVETVLNLPTTNIEILVGNK